MDLNDIDFDDDVNEIKQEPEEKKPVIKTKPQPVVK